jgi:membrane-associated phospholipid phosphatase
VKPISTPALLGVLMLAFGCLLGLAVASGELLKLAERPGGSTGVDRSITSWMVAHRAQGLTWAAKALSTLGSQVVLVPITTILTVLLVLQRRLVAAGVLLACWGGGTGLYVLTKHWVQRHRPPSDLWLVGVGSSSFPSGHATQSAATFVAIGLVGAVWLAYGRRAALALAVLLAAAIGWSRVYLGVHWATDVASGWLLAAAWVAIVLRVAAARDRFPWRSPSPPRRAEP